MIHDYLSEVFSEHFNNLQNEDYQDFLNDPVNNLDLNEEFNQLYRELNEDLAIQLIEESQHNEAYHYEKYQQ